MSWVVDLQKTSGGSLTYGTERAMRVVLAMSGGVDSSASAWLLREQGHEVIGLFMRSGAVHEEVCAVGSDDALPIVTARSSKQGCCSARDAADARRVADALDIPFHALDFRDGFGRIQDYFADEYLAGRTPNPCVMCNVWLKFGRLWEFARSVGADRIATGHYARLTEVAGEDRPALRRGADPAKDQSYVLFGIDRDLLDRIVFPVGESAKETIRGQARAAGLKTADKPDSQEICFVPDDDYAGFVARHRGMPDTSGELVDTEGRVVGRHAGYERFTIGQRKGLGTTFGSPRFVVRIESETRRVVIGRREDLARTELEADRANWLAASVPARFACTAQVRYRQRAVPVEVHVLDEARFRVEFAEPEYGVAPGQAVVLYAGDRVLGGGWIR